MPPRLTYPTALVLLAIREGRRHGFDIIDATGLPSGTVYPVLRRLEQGGLLRARWENPAVAQQAKRPPRRYYQLTARGTATAAEALERYPRLGLVLAPPGEPSPSPA
jgi:DNA-binding PadR family transcriptional regulator